MTLLLRAAVPKCPFERMLALPFTRTSATLSVGCGRALLFFLMEVWLFWSPPLLFLNLWMHISNFFQQGRLFVFLPLFFFLPLLLFASHPFASPSFILSCLPPIFGVLCRCLFLLYRGRRCARCRAEQHRRVWSRLWEVWRKWKCVKWRIEKVEFEKNGRKEEQVEINQ